MQIKSAVSLGRCRSVGVLTTRHTRAAYSIQDSIRIMIRLFLLLSLALMSASSSSSLSEAKEDDDICPNVSEGEPTGVMVR